MKTFKILSKISLLFAALLLIPSCAVNPVTGKKQLMLMSESQEIALGAQYNPSVLSTFGVYEDDDLMNFVTAKGIEMGKISHRPNLQYHFQILDSPVINAFAVPGGYIYLTRGILAQFNNEAELIGVLGHEMGHITARHTAAQQTRQQLGQILVIGGMLASEKFAQFGEQAMQGMQLLFLKFSRDNEREADRLGVEYSSKIRYDAHKMADFFDVLNKMSLKSSHGGVPTFLSTHPDPGDRYNSVHKKAEQWQDSLNYAGWAVNANNYLDMIDGMVYGDDPRQGYVDANMFYHPQMQFQYPIPPGWQLVNSPMQVQMAPEDGKSVMIFTTAKQKSLQEAASQTLQELQLTQLESKQTTVNGFPAIGTVAQQVPQQQQTGQQQQAIKVMSYFIDYNGTIFVFHGVAAEADFNSYFRLFETTMLNFKRLTDPRKLNVKPKRILVKSVRRSGTLADAFKYFGVPQAQMQELALLNNLELADKVSQGKKIKIIGD